MVKTTTEQVDALIAEHKVFMISKSYCPFCTKAKQAITAAGGKFEVLEIENDENMDVIQDYMRSKTGGRSVPRVFIDGKFIGGGDETAALQRSGDLVKMV